MTDPVRPRVVVLHAEQLRIIQGVALILGVPEEAILSHSKVRRVVDARRRVWVELRALGWSYTEIGKLWNYDHATVVRGIESYATEVFRLKNCSSLSSPSGAPR